jgi:hypothetical protein
MNSALVPYIDAHMDLRGVNANGTREGLLWGWAHADAPLVQRDWVRVRACGQVVPYPLKVRRNCHTACLYGGGMISRCALGMHEPKSLHTRGAWEGWFGILLVCRNAQQRDGRDDVNAQ